MIHTEKIEFVRTRRPLSVEGRAIYDHHVMIDGEHRATWRFQGVGNGYRLANVDTGRTIMHPQGRRADNPNVIVRETPVEASNQGAFEFRTLEALSAGLIPTLAQMAVTREANRLAAIKRAEEEKERDRLHAIRCEAGTLYEAAKKALAYLDATAPEPEKLTADRIATVSALTLAIAAAEDIEGTGAAGRYRSRVDG